MSRPRPLVRFTDRAAITRLVAQHYPQVYRIAAALTGNRALAESTAKQVMKRALPQLHRWTDAAHAQRWFMHHTVLVSRQAIATRGYGGADPLAPTPPAAALAVDDPLFRLLQGALSALTMQQREAFLLHHGEHFDLRQLATAMDCSTAAAANHLAAATQRLRPLAADRLAEFTAALPHVLAGVVPPPTTISLRITQEVRRYLWPRLLIRWIAWPLLLLTIGAAAYATWRLWPMLVV
jgi:DNA-directed RNA polymerase specialized sigma24 family protein